METSDSKPNSRRTRRSAEQWHAILTRHFATDETPQELADRLGCALSTVEAQMKLATAPTSQDPKAQPAGFVEIKRPAAPDAEMSLRTTAGVILTFSKLPPPSYLAQTLEMLG